MLQLQVPKPLGPPSKYRQAPDDDFACGPLLIFTIKITKMKLSRHIKKNIVVEDSDLLVAFINPRV